MIIGQRIGSPIPVEASIRIEPFLPGFASYVKREMERHGGRLVWQHNVLTAYFPVGTQKWLLWPVTRDCRYEIIFPDGYEILEIETRSNRHILVFDPEIFPKDLRARYPSIF